MKKEIQFFYATKDVKLTGLPNNEVHTIKEGTFIEGYFKGKRIHLPSFADVWVKVEGLVAKNPSFEFETSFDGKNYYFSKSAYTGKHFSFSVRLNGRPCNPSKSILKDLVFDMWREIKKHLGEKYADRFSQDLQKM